jgi:hypothetical protein
MSTRSIAEERTTRLTTLKLSARYVRYLLTSLATVAFGLTTN